MAVILTIAIVFNYDTTLKEHLLLSWSIMLATVVPFEADRELKTLSSHSDFA